MICCIIYKKQTQQEHSVITVYSWSGLWSELFYFYKLQMTAKNYWFEDKYRYEFT
jgi:hypothetical protein